ncbi:pyridoxamine 5'-phosphate oxidase family protein [Cyclobacterium sp. 1_MG-2023]|uniref:pyridoxamine 5'-phosphate oxidase family protein n=1 Tax=Cyclobacterium sp. 1_MG-2023 TaxID=3062681 RepID=UPI0026E2840A|nr:pyridoxamine 5'-phosphate oxidase family protein [Cyclobacterium sp. 1_MG-2023]MDO6440410.1 pyridoxamine 5'-phosphate oxidase family protein [Cyclobacterium sp. 1_MG-2023]
MSGDKFFEEKTIDQLKELAESIRFAIMGTNLKSLPPHFIPMTTKEVDENGSIWFLSSEKSTHNKNIIEDNNLQLIYSNPKNMQFLTVYGQAIIYKGSVILERFYDSKVDGIWFDGIGDPDLTAIKVVPTEAHYWDKTKGELINLIKVGKESISAIHPEPRLNGKLTV